MKHENKCKRKGKKVLLALEEKNDKNLICTLDRSKRERRTFLKKFKSDLTRGKQRFKKNSLYDF